MRFVIGVRSDVAYGLLTKLINHQATLPKAEFQKRNVENLRDLEDAIEFYDADVYIIDMHLEDAEVMIDTLKQSEREYVLIENDVKEVLPVLIERYGVVEEKTEIYYEREEKEQVIIQEKIIEKEVIRTAYQAIPSKVVVVGSLYRGAGSTTLATNIARMVAKRGIDVSYVEHPLIQPYMFDYLQIIADEDNPYTDISMEIKEEGITRSKRESWIKHGIKWHVIDSRKPTLSTFSYENLLVLSHAIQSNVLIIDISDRWLDPEIQKYLFMADSILVCIEPDPIKYDRSLYSVGDFKPHERKIMDYLTENKELSHFELVLMKNVKGIDIKLVKEMLHKKPVATIPFIPYQDMQKALFKSQLLYDFEDNASYFEDNLIPTLVKFVPKDFLELGTNQDNLFMKLLKIGKK